MSDLPVFNSVFDNCNFRPRLIVPVDEIVETEFEQIEEIADDNDNDQEI